MSEFRAALILGFFVLTVLGLPALLLDELPLLAWIQDDAFYYFQVARNLVEGNGFTFDGIHRTNGYHPLWLFGVTPLFALFETGTPPLRAVAMLQAALIAGASFLIFRTLTARIGRAPAAVAALSVVVIPGSRAILWNGLESSLFFFMLALVWNRWLALSEEDDAPAWRWVELGVWSALTFGSRLEGILVVPAILFLGRKRFVEKPALALVLVTPSALAVVSYLAWNRILFDTWLPISAMVKSHWTQKGAADWLQMALKVPWAGREAICRVMGAHSVPACPRSGVAIYVAIEAILAGAVLFFRRRLATLIGQAGLGFILLAGGLIIAVDVYSVSVLPDWYQGPILLATALIAGSLLAGRRGLGTGAVVLLVLAASVRTGMILLRTVDTTTQYAHYRVQAGRWVADNIAEGSRLASWNAGMFRYYSDHPVINLDGLVNDRAYYERVTVGRDLEGYLQDEAIEYLADQACGPEPTPGIYLRRSGSEFLEDRFVLVKTLFNPRTPDQCPGYAVWRYLGASSVSRKSSGNSGGSRQSSKSVATSSLSSPAR